MNGFIVAGKAFCVIEDLRQEAERHKGKTVAEFLQKRKLEKLQQAEAKQFSTSVETIRAIE